jgi:peptidoglycan/xylan/chitin deacetylase (PgdA/CDA1 family)
VSDVRFTYDWYREFLERLQARGYRSRPYTTSPGSGDLFLRHDVDFSPRKALRIARIEADVGLQSTFLFLVTSPAYNPWFKPTREVIGAIRELGHEVGLHFSTHQYWSAEPDEAALRERVDAEFDVLSGLVDSPDRVLSFHRPPEWVFGRSYDGFVSTYEPQFFSEVSYLSDSNMRWRDEPPLPDDADDADDGTEALQVLTHPGLWGRTDASFEARLRSEIDRELGRVRQFMVDQFVHKEYNVDDYCYPTTAPQLRLEADGN